jgi:hypothetical protein
LALIKNTDMNQLQQQLFAIERKLWTNDPVFYREHFKADALLIFSDIGRIALPDAVAAIEQENREGRQWAEVLFTETECRQLSGHIALISYTAKARWQQESEYITVIASSLYTAEGGCWKVVLHQQCELKKD